MWRLEHVVRVAGGGRGVADGVSAVGLLGNICAVGAQSAVDWRTATVDLDTEAGIDNDVVPSSYRLFGQSTKRPKLERKSGTREDGHNESRRRNPTLWLRGSHP
jgi:hypothetical protein